MRQTFSRTSFTSLLVAQLIILATRFEASGQSVYKHRLTIDELKFIAVSRMINLSDEGSDIDSVLRTKGFVTQELKSGKIVYVNDSNDMYTSGYNKESGTLYLFLDITEYDYYAHLRKDILERFKKLKEGPFFSYKVAEVFDAGLIKFITGVDLSRNTYMICISVEIAGGR